MVPGGISETDGGTYPQVFVIDSQASNFHVPVQRKTKWAWDGQKFLLLLVGLTVIGLFIEGFLICNLYQRTQGFSSCDHPCNISSPLLSSQQNTLMKREGSNGHNGEVGENDIVPWVKEGEASIYDILFLKRPFAHLLGKKQGRHSPLFRTICDTIKANQGKGPSNELGDDDIVQWVKDGDASIQNMLYENGRLRIQEAGHYYLYSKVQLKVEECKLILHKVMKNTAAYGIPIELMQSKSHRCWVPKQSSTMEDLWSSFLAGIFQLQNGDEIFVKVEKIQALRQGPTENFMGAFMVSP